MYILSEDWCWLCRNSIFWLSEQKQFLAGWLPGRGVNYSLTCGYIRILSRQFALPLSESLHAAGHSKSALHAFADSGTMAYSELHRALLFAFPGRIAERVHI